MKKKLQEKDFIITVKKTNDIVGEKSSTVYHRKELIFEEL